jgi:hypothetical protein
MIKAIASSRKEDSVGVARRRHRLNLNLKINKGDRLIPQRRQRRRSPSQTSPLSKRQNWSMNTIMAQLPESAQSKLEQYLRRDDFNSPLRNQSPEHPFPKREPIKHLLIGSSKAVTSTIHSLQVIGYASTGDWSPLLPTGNPDEVMSILIRQILMR